LRAVSTIVSPLFTLEPMLVSSRVSAPSRRAASVKLERVRVESSKKRLAMVRLASWDKRGD
jgi:hypothetical protein